MPKEPPSRRARAYLSALDAYAAVLRRTMRIRPGVTIVTVNFNSLAYLQTALKAIDRYAPEASVFIVDNDSRDESPNWLKQSGLPHLNLLNNIWHGPAMDLGFLRAGTEYVIALDVDAFPISDDFVEHLIGPLREGATVCGASFIPSDPSATNFGRRYVHPCCLAMRLDRFVERRHTFRATPTSDVGELITLREDAPHFIDATSTRGPGWLGTVFGEIVYHNFYGTRFSNNDRQRIDHVDRHLPDIAWQEAIHRYLD